ncbi:TPA: hypothetical protein RZK36_000502 [Campylobacter coli]|nr:hypothetical protein [Campylobacter coli]
MYHDLAVVIPVRMGSSRIKNKMLLELDGISLLEWKIRQIQIILPNNQIFVSTESEVLKSIAKKCGVMIHHREFFLADQHRATFSEVITGIVKDIPYKHIAWVTAVVPLMKPAEYKNAFDIYYDECIYSSKHDSLFSANLLKEYLWNSHVAINYSADKNHTISQELPNIYKVTNGLYMRDKEAILREGYFIGQNPYKYCVSKISGIDIDEYIDYEIAKNLLPLYKNENI